RGKSSTRFPCYKIFGGKKKPKKQTVTLSKPRKKVYASGLSREQKLEHYIKSMLAKEEEAPVNDKEWLFEIKWDCYRAIADLRQKQPLFYSRNGISFLQKFAEVAEDFANQKHKMILDGELVVFDADGKPNFQLLQQIDDYPQAEVVYQVFDLLWLNGFSTEELALTERKELLKEA